MKLIFLLLFSINAFAHGEDSHPETSIPTNNSSQSSGSSEQRVTSSAISPSLTQFDVCPIVSPSSKAASVFIASVSGTTGTTLNPICVAWHLQQPKIVHQMACNASDEYRKAVQQVGMKCE